MYPSHNLVFYTHYILQYSKYFSILLTNGPFGWRVERGRMEENRVELAKNRLILGQNLLYSTLLPVPPPSIQTDHKYPSHDLVFYTHYILQYYKYFSILLTKYFDSCLFLFYFIFITSVLEPSHQGW